MITSVTITGSSSSLSTSIIHHLTSVNNLEIQTTGIPQLIIHVVGFAPPSLTETLYHTSYLTKLLDTCLSQKSQLVVVIPKHRDPLHDVVITLLKQYRQKFNLPYSLLEVNSRLQPDQLAAIVVASIFPTPPPVRQPKRNPPPMIAVKLLVLLWLMPWVFYLLESLVLFRLLSCSWSSFQATNWTRAEVCAQLAGNLSTFMGSQTPFVLGAEPLFNSQGYSPSSLAKVIPALSDSLFWAGSVGEQFTPVLLPLFNSHVSAISPNTTTSSSLNSLAQSLVSFQSLLRKHYLDAPVKPNFFSSVDKEVDQIHNTVTTLQVLLPDLPRLLSTTTTSTYLVLIQDNSQLRPSGGVTNQLAFVSLNAGHITNIEFRSPENIDSQLRGQLDPPDDLKTQLNEPFWHTQDSNWSPDVPTSARQTLRFIDNSLSRQVDGVVFVNFSLFSRLLEIAHPDKDNSITAANFLSVTKTLQSDLPGLNQAQLIRVIKVLFDSFSSRQSFIVPLPSLNRVSRLSWDGGLINPPCKTTSCSSDFFYTVDSNVSQDKIDQLITRDFSYTVNLSSTQIESDLTLTYQNSDHSSAYRDYLRIYLPADVELLDQPPNSLATTEFGLTQVSIPFNLLPQAHTTIILKYAKKINPSSSFHYQLTVPNQPGIASVFRAVVNFPSTWSAGTSFEPEFATSGQVKYNAVLDQQFQTEIDYTIPNHP